MLSVGQFSMQITRVSGSVLSANQQLLNGDIKAIDEVTFSYIHKTDDFYSAVFWAGDIQNFMNESNRTFSLHFIYDEYLKSHPQLFVNTSTEALADDSAPDQKTEALADEVAVIQNGKRNFIKKEYYRISEVAETLSCTVDDLIHLAANGEIPIIVLLSGKFGFLLDENFNDVSNPRNIKAINDKYGYVSKKFLAVYESERSQGKKAELLHILRSDNSGNYWMLIDTDCIPLEDNSLFILSSDIPLPDYP
jgi:hypothetical protein